MTKKFKKHFKSDVPVSPRAEEPLLILLLVTRNKPNGFLEGQWRLEVKKIILIRGAKTFGTKIKMGSLVTMQKKNPY